MNASGDGLGSVHHDELPDSQNGQYEAVAQSECGDDRQQRERGRQWQIWGNARLAGVAWCERDKQCAHGQKEGA